PAACSRAAYAPGSPPATRALAGPSTRASAARRRPGSRQRGSATRGSSARAGFAPCPGSRDGRFVLRLGLGPAAFDEPDHAGCGLLDRELGDLDHRAAEPAVERLGLLELRVDLEKLRIGPLVTAQASRSLATDLLQALR